MKSSLKMPVADGQGQLYRTPVGCAGGPKIVLDTANSNVGNGRV